VSQSVSQSVIQSLSLANPCVRLGAPHNMARFDYAVKVDESVNLTSECMAVVSLRLVI
jgi:hypothetical protein